MKTIESKNISRDPLGLILSVLCIGALSLLFAPYVGKLYEMWMSSSHLSYSHSILMPFVILYLIWDRRGELAKLTVIPSWKGGFVALILSAMIWLIAVSGNSRWAIEMDMVFLIISLVWMNYGTKITKKLAFPLFLLFMMVPMPIIFYSHISNSLQLISSKMAVGFMHLFSVPVYREGNVINLASTKLEVANACSGISSLISLFTLAMIFAYITHKAFWKRFIIVASSLPIAVIMNWFRIAATGMLTHYWSEKIAQGFYHSFSGWLVFVAAFVILYLENGVINLLSKQDA